jgi:glycosyltransferase involved in cell wall biosynthesis
MRISIDASGLGLPKTGTAVYIEEILKVWAHCPDFKDQVLIFTTSRGASHLSGVVGSDCFTLCSAPENRLVRIFWQQAVLPFLLCWHKVEVHWGAGFVLPLLSNVPGVVTIFDLTFQILPAVHERAKRLYFPAMIRAAVAKARQVLTISESAASDLIRLHPEAAGKTHVTLLAPREMRQAAVRADLPTARNLTLRLLFVGTLEPRKNLKRLLEAWQRIPSEVRASAELAIVGATGWMIKDVIGKSETLERVSLLGSLSDEDLAKEYAKADVFVYPSLYEGFGLPVVEAMAMGLPVLTSDIGATREVAGDAAILVDPYSVDSICAGLRQLISNNELRQHLGAKGLKRAAEFSWNSTANQTLAVVHKAAQSISRATAKTITIA